MVDGIIAASVVHFFGLFINKIIVGLFLVNAAIFFIILFLCRGIRKLIDETRLPENARLDPHQRGESYVEKLRRNYPEWGRRYRDITPWVHYYSILTTIFPLLGILGTVCGLLQAQSDFSKVEGAFLLALSSTFYGLVAAIVSKAGEGFFTPDIDRFKIVYEMFTKDMINLERVDSGVPEPSLAPENRPATKNK